MNIFAGCKSVGEIASVLPRCEERTRSHLDALRYCSAGGRVHPELPEHIPACDCCTRSSPSPLWVFSFVKTLHPCLARSPLLYKTPIHFTPDLLAYLSLWLCLPQREGWHSCHSLGKIQGYLSLSAGRRRGFHNNLLHVFWHMIQFLHRLKSGSMICPVLRRAVSQ